MSEHDHGPRSGFRPKASWLVAGAAAALVAVIALGWDNSDEVDLAQTSPVVEDPDAAEVSEEEVVEENTRNEIEVPDAAANDFDAAAADGDPTVLEEAGHAVISGPDVDPDVSPEANEVADEAALENQIIEERADEDNRETSPVTDAQRVADEVEGEEVEGNR